MASITEERALSKIEESLKTVYEKIGKKYYEEFMDELTNKLELELK